MENKSHALAAGTFVLAVLLLLIGLAMWLMRDVANTNTYELVTNDAVSGLQVQAPVRFKGVAIGKVTSINFDPSARGSVLVRVAVSPDAPITRSTYAALAFQGVTGLSFIQLDDEGTATEAPPPGPNGPPRLPLRPSALGQLTDRVGDLMEKVDKAADRVTELLGPTNQAALTTALTEAGRAAQSIQQLAANTDRTIQLQLGPGKADIPGLLQQSQGTLKSIQDAANQTRQTAANLNGVTSQLGQSVVRIAGPGGVIDRMSESADTVTTSTLPRIQKLTEDASRTIRRLDRVANTLGDNPQSLLYGTGAIPPGPGEPGYVAPVPRQSTMP